MISIEKQRKQREKKIRRHRAKHGMPFVEQTDHPHSPSSHLPPGAIVIQNPPGMEKMSEVLLEFAEPYLGEDPDRKKLQSVLQVAIVAWNAAILPRSQGQDLIREMATEFPQELKAPFMALVDDMVSRKRIHFAGNSRFILSLDFTMTADGEPHVQVGSSLDGRSSP